MNIDRTAFAAAVADIRELFRRSELRIAGPSGRPATMPVLDDDLIGFNSVNRRACIVLRNVVEIRQKVGRGSAFEKD